MAKPYYLQTQSQFLWYRTGLISFKCTKTVDKIIISGKKKRADFPNNFLCIYFYLKYGQVFEHI